MLGQVVDKLDSWLGRSFVLATYLPCLIFTVFNALLLCVDRPEFAAFLAAEYKEAVTSKALDSLVVLIAVAVIAFTISPMIRVATQLLEGEGLPAWIAEPLLVSHAERRERLAAREKALQPRLSRLPSVDQVEETLKRSRTIGESLKQMTDPVAILDADDAVKSLAHDRMLNRPVDVGAFMSAVATLARALERNCAETGLLQPPIDRPTWESAERLDALHEQMFGTLAPYVIDIAEQTESREADRRSRQFAEAELAPTRLGNDAAQLRSYCETRYGIDFDLIWPRLQLVIQKDEKLSAAIVRSKIQVDFSIASLMLTVLSGSCWLFTFALIGRSPLTLLVVALVLPPMTYGWLSILHVSFADFSELVRSAVDLTRRDLLARLSLPLPTTVGGEQDTWTAIGRWLNLNEVDRDTLFEPVKRS